MSEWKQKSKPKNIKGLRRTPPTPTTPPPPTVFYLTIKPGGMDEKSD